MHAGVCGIVDGDFDVVDSYTETVESDGRELSRSIEIERVFSLPSGARGFEGHGAAERMVTRTDTEIVAGQIEVTETEVKETVRTRFAGVTGDVVVTESSKGTFVFDLVGSETATTIERGTIDLSGFLDAHQGGSPWKAGFYDHDGNAETGTVYGDDLLRDESFAPVLDGAALNQLGIDYTYDGRDVKADLTESGFVQLYQPNNVDTAAFLEFVVSEIQPHLGSA